MTRLLHVYFLLLFFFFFQAEDGIRDDLVTGVQTCALPIWFEFIHIDISQANHDATHEDIVAATKEVVEYAKTTGALVESEPHYFGGGSNDFTEAIDYEEIDRKSVV